MACMQRPTKKDRATRTAPDLCTDIGGLTLRNPVMTASGTFGYGGEYSGLVDLNRLGAVIVKGLSLSPAKGNPPPRIVETACGMLNAIGLENIGLDAFVTIKLPFLKKLLTPVAGQHLWPDRGRIRRAGPPSRSGRRRRGDRGQHLLPQRQGGRRSLRGRPPMRPQRGECRPPLHDPSAHRKAFPQRDRHHPHRPPGRGFGAPTLFR